MGRSDRKDEFIWRFGYEKQNLASKSRKIAKKLRNDEGSVAKEQIEPDNGELVKAGEESFYSESVLDSDSGFAQQGGFLDQCKSFLPP